MHDNLKHSYLKHFLTWKSILKTLWAPAVCYVADIYSSDVIIHDCHFSLKQAFWKWTKVDIVGPTFFRWECQVHITIQTQILFGLRLYNFVQTWFFSMYCSIPWSILFSTFYGISEFNFSISFWTLIGVFYRNKKNEKKILECFNMCRITSFVLKARLTLSRSFLIFQVHS